MKRWAILFAAALLLSGDVVGGELTAAEVKLLKSDVAAMMDSFDHGDATVLLAKTHESVYALAGGKDALEKLTKDAVSQLVASGLKIIQSDLGKPSRTYLAGDEEVCFIPRVTIAELQGKRVKSTSFMIAIRKRGSDEWKYLDGQGVGKNPEILHRLLPQLDRGIDLPPIRMEML